MQIGGVGADDRYSFVFVLRQRKQVVLVLEQHDGLACCFQSELLMLRAVGDFFGVVGIGVRAIEKASDEFGAQNTSHGAVDRSFRHFSLLNLLDQAAIRLIEREFDVNAGVERQPGGFVFGRNDVMDGAQLCGTEVVGGDESLESPFSSQNILQQVFV